MDPPPRSPQRGGTNDYHHPERFLDDNAGGEPG
jgi:hypothetical protein